MTAAAARHEPALRFWLRYAEREGALVEDVGHGALVLLPDGLQKTSELPEEITVTSDPDVAREEGAALLIPGHPTLERAATAALAGGDAGMLYLPWPASRRPSPATLEARARELVGIAHGRIDAAGEVAAVYVPLLRVGVMISYAASLRLRFQEQEEAWVDARSGTSVGERTLKEVARHPWLREPDARHQVLPPNLALAVGAANESLERRAEARRDALRAQARRGLESELAVADAYYEEALDSIARRRARATPDRQRLLDAQADVTRAEQARRRREIEEEFDARCELRPFRLHLVHVPAYVLPVHVRRGSRAFPLELHWIAAVDRFATPRCPACGAAQPLVAGRDRLGCVACSPGAAAAAARSGGGSSGRPGRLERVCASTAPVASEPQAASEGPSATKW